MSFLNPAAMAVAAALTIPALLALYFLKLKRTVYRVPSTLLWKRSIEDLRVNAPFQRLRGSLLLFLQLLALLLGAIALGKPMFETAETYERTVMILIDRSASMNVIEDNGQSRLEQAKEQAKRCVRNMDDEARAMVIAFCDRPTVISSFDTDKSALARKIDSITASESTSNLAEAVSLAEAYTQNVVIAGEEAGGEAAPVSAAAPATVFVFTDGRIEDADRVALHWFDVDKMTVTTIGDRADNVGIIAMDARRNYERPEVLQVAATVVNFGAEPMTIDAALYVDGEHVDVQTIRLAGSDRATAPLGEGGQGGGESGGAHTNVVAFDEIVFEQSGVVEVVLRVDDALHSDNRAWTIIEEPRHVRVLLVTDGNLFLSNVLPTLPIELVTMTPADYEQAAESVIQDGNRSAFDLVMLDRHSSGRLPRGNYFFWGGVPLIEGVTAGETIENEIIVNWDETHPLLRHTAPETLFVYEWLKLTLPPEAVDIIEGETSPVLSYFTRGANRYLISAFSLTVEDDEGMTLLNTYWVTTVDFVVFVQNAVQFLSSNVALRGTKSMAPGDSVTLPIPRRAKRVKVVRPNGTEDLVSVASSGILHYARTRAVGPYRVVPGVPGQDQFAVNLFNTVESRVEPSSTLTLGAEVVAAQAGAVKRNRPTWRYFALAMLALLLFEWIVYNRRVVV